MTTINISIEDSEKAALEEMLDEMGLNLSTFYSIYTKRALRDRKIPFEIEASADQFYSASNMAQIKKSEQQVKEGKVIIKTMEELEAMESDEKIKP